MGVPFCLPFKNLGWGMGQVGTETPKSPVLSPPDRGTVPQHGEALAVESRAWGWGGLPGGPALRALCRPGLSLHLRCR